MRAAFPDFSSDLEQSMQKIAVLLHWCNDSVGGQMRIVGRAVAEPLMLRALFWCCCALPLPTHKVLGFLRALKALAEVCQRHVQELGGPAAACALYQCANRLHLGSVCLCRPIPPSPPPVHTDDTVTCKRGPLLTRFMPQIPTHPCMLQPDDSALDAPGVRAALDAWDAALADVAEVAADALCACMTAGDARAVAALEVAPPSFFDHVLHGL